MCVCVCVCVCVCGEGGDYYATRTKTNRIFYCSSFSLLLLFIILVLPFPLFYWHRQSTLIGLYLKYSQRSFFVNESINLKELRNGEDNRTDQN